MGAEESKVEAIFYAALEKSSAVERAAYLDEACADDSELRSRVELFLDAQPNLGKFLEKSCENRKVVICIRFILLIDFCAVAHHDICRFAVIHNKGQTSIL